ncbi:MAG: hypothetical protein IKQ12_05920 [Prevotella sp.]|nr:hypothetical protein [Prevotella sp.]
MKVEIVLGDEFKRQFKRLAKKYPSLKDDSIEITLLTIYDKGEISSVTDKYIKWLVSLING